MALSEQMVVSRDLCACNHYGLDATVRPLVLLLDGWTDAWNDNSTFHWHDTEE